PMRSVELMEGRQAAATTRARPMPMVSRERCLRIVPPHSVNRCRIVGDTITKVSELSILLTETVAILSARMGTALEHAPLVDRIRAIVGDVLQMPPPAADVPLLDVGANSIDVIRLANRFEDEFGFRPAVDELFELPTAAAIAEFYAANTTAGAAF